MHIHNYFSDVLLSVQVLFDTYVFRPNYIRHYEFNMANRSFSLMRNDYRTEYEFPTAIVTLEEDNYSFGERPTVIQGGPENKNQIPVVYDAESRNYIDLQEEQTQCRIGVVINCESQFQAKEVGFQIKRILPLNKYIQIFDFTSFLEIPAGFLLSLGMNFNDREITNLFTRLNNNTGEMEYCYAVNYKPLIRLESADVSISDTSQRSFPVTIGLTYQVQQPMWIAAAHIPGTIGAINIDFMRFGEEPISQNNVRPIYNQDTTDKFGGIKRLSRRNLLVRDLNDYEFLELPDLDKVSFGISFNKEDFPISVEYEFDFFDTTGQLRKNVKPSLIDVDANKVTFEFTREEYELYYKATLVKPIIVQFIEIRE